jgi:hypothetical protein
MDLVPNPNQHIMEEFKMKIRTIESNTRMRFLLGNNPMGEMVKIVLSKCKKAENKEKNEIGIRSKSFKS